MAGRGNTSSGRRVTADTFTTFLRLIKQTIGANKTTWGTNQNSCHDMIDEAIAGQVSVSVTAGNVTLSTANNATDQSRPALLILTGTPGTTRTVTFPDVKKLTWVINNSDSAATLKAGVGTTVSLPVGGKILVYTDGATNLAALDGPYVEGTFTPTLGDGTNNFTLGTAVGTYTRIGRVVFIQLNCTWSSIGSAGSGQLRIGGLPFPIGSSSGSPGFTFGQVSGVDTNGGANFITGFSSSSLSAIAFKTSSDNAASANLAANSCSATGQIAGSAVYFV